MTFDFSNYTYSGLITIFSMVMGMAYPTVQSAIQDIDSKYDSGQLVEYFMTEASYKWFRFCLALSILFALCCPFVLKCCKVVWVHYTWMFVHTLVVLALLATAIKLYITIMTYYRPTQLVEYIKARANEERTKVASVLADIANFAASKGQKKVYMAAEQTIAYQLAEELREQKYDIKSAEYDLENPSTFNSTLSTDMNRAIERMVGILKNRDYDTFYTIDSTIVSLLYNILEQHTMSDGLRNLIWRMVSDVALSDNKEWILSYWGVAEQYMRSLKFSIRTTDEKKNKRLQEDIMTIKEFHAAFGGMLIKYGKTKWLRDILFFTNSQPATYPLLSNTFADVVDMLDHFEKMLRWPNVWIIQKRYNMYGVQNGVNTEAVIVYNIELFLAIELLRLWHIDYNAGLGKPLDTLQVGVNAEDNEKYITLLERMKWCVNEVYDNNINGVLNFRIPSKKQVVGFIDDNIKSFKDKLQNIYANPEIDNVKINKIIENVKNAADEWKKSSADIEKDRFSEVQHFVMTMPHNFPKEYILKNFSLSFPSLGSDAVEGLNYVFNNVLPSFLKMHQAVESYRISYRHVGEALRKLALNADYVVVALGFDSESYFQINGYLYPEAICKDGICTFNGASIYTKPCRGEASLVIMRKDDVPMADLVRNDTDSDVDLISDTGSMPIYSNIKRLDIANLNVFFRIYVDVYYPLDLKFIRIIIPNVFSDNKYDLDNVRSIRNLMNLKLE